MRSWCSWRRKLADKEVEVKAVSRRHARAVKRAAEAKAEYEKCGKKPAQPGKAAKQEADVKRYQEKKKRLRQERKDREGELMELVRELRELKYPALVSALGVCLSAVLVLRLRLCRRLAWI